MTAKLIVACLLVFSAHGMEMVMNKKLRRARDNSSSFGFGQLGDSGSTDEDSQLKGLTDSIQGLFKPAAQDKQHVESAPAAQRPAKGQVKPAPRTPIVPPKMMKLMSKKAEEAPSSKKSVPQEAPSSKKSASQKSQAAPISKSEADARADADLQKAAKIAERAKKAARVLAKKAEQTANATKTMSEKRKAHSEPAVAATTSKPVASHAVETTTAAPHKKAPAHSGPALKPTAPVAALDHSPTPKPAQRKPQSAEAVSSAAKSVSRPRPGAAHWELPRQNADKSKLKQVAVDSKSVDSKRAPSSNWSTTLKKVKFEATVANSTKTKKEPLPEKSSSTKSEPVITKSTNSTTSSTSSTEKSLKPESTANMSSIVGAKSSNKSEAAGSFPAEASNNASNATRNATNATLDDQVVHGLPMASLVFGDDDDKQQKKPTNNASTAVSRSDSTTVQPAANHIGNATNKSDSAWKNRVNYLESQIEQLKQKLQEKQGGSAPASPSESPPQKEHAPSKPSVTVATNASKKVKSALLVHQAVLQGAYVHTDSDATNNVAQSVPEKAVLFTGELRDLSNLRRQPFAFGTFEEAPTVARPSSFWGYVTALFGSRQETVTAAVEPPKPKESAKASFIAVRKGVKQNYDRTARATIEDGMQTVSLSDSFGALENQDVKQEEYFHHQDAVARMHAQKPEPPHKPTKEELEGRNQTEISSFWGSLEKEDQTIEQSLSGSDSLDDYERLTQDQNDRVSRAAATLNQDKLNVEQLQLHRNDRGFEAKTIHDEWENFEKRDKKRLGEIKHDPNLQMLQLRHTGRRQHA